MISVQKNAEEEVRDSSHEDLSKQTEERSRSTIDHIAAALLEQTTLICEANDDEKLRKTDSLLNVSNWQTHPFYDEKEKDPQTR